jgi:outer membrane protein
MSVRKAILVIMIAAFIPMAASAAKLTKVAVVDLSRIVSDFFQESSAWREIEQLREKKENTVEQRKEELNRLKQRKLEAQDEGKENLVLQLEEEIRKKEEYLKEYNRIMSQRIESKRNNLLTSSDFSKEIIRAVEYVAEQEGFSIVLRKKDPNIVYYNYEVDITEKVLEYLRRQSGSDESNG